VMDYFLDDKRSMLKLSDSENDSVCREAFIHVHYRSKVWGHLEMSLFLKEKHFFCPLK